MCKADKETSGGVRLDVSANPCPVQLQAAATVHHVTVGNNSNHDIFNVEVFVRAANRMFGPGGKISDCGSLTHGRQPFQAAHRLSNTPKASAPATEEIVTTVTFNPSMQDGKIPLVASYLIPIRP